jgi:hypothetical protein
VELDLVLPVDLRQHTPHLLAKDTLQRHAPRRHHRHLNTELPERGRDLGADEAHADNDRLPPGEGLRADPVGVVDAAEVIDPLEVEAGDRRAAVPGPGREQQLVVGQALTAPELDDPLGWVDAHGAGAQSGLDLSLGIEVGRTDEGVLEGDLAAEVLLRKRWPFVGEMRLLPYEDEPAFEALLTQHCRGCGPGEARTHDDMSLELQSST